MSAVLATSPIAPLAIPRELRERQHKASDPARSIWVSANAGSGKTHVLTQRVIRLLLAGTPPSKILCLTFTKAAAAQMATRVFDALSRWTDMTDPQLREAIVETGAPSPSASDLVLARRLFTRTVETPGGLKIQTIHAFCERLLHLFPFEANVPARFEVADDARAAELLARAKRAAIAEARRTAGLEAALALVADLAGGAGGVDTLIGAAMRLRAAARGRPDGQASLAERLGVGADASPAAIRRAMLTDGIAPEHWPAVATLLDEGMASDRKHAARLQSAAGSRLRGSDDPASLQRALDAYFSVFFDAKRQPRPSLLTKKFALAHPDLATDLAREQDRLVALRETLRAAEAVERTNALLALTEAVTRRYEAAKIAGGVLDFDDLIERTLALLDRSDSGWVLHKLDAGIDHVLVDEAQDTSHTQWRILEALTGDFASGAGGRSTDRSFFVVGDDKQSIFSFQGAAPLMFDTMRSAFERRFTAGAKPFERVSLKTSFRSVPGILAAVDTVFALDAHQDGLVRKPDLWPLHESIKARLPSLVEIWPPLGAAPAEDPAEWSIPLDAVSERDPASVVADHVAAKIHQLLAPDGGEWVHDGRGEARRAIRAGDILILVRTRNEVFEAVIRALKRYRVPVAGADRLDVANHIAVMDLAAAGRVALLPRDDLSLACVLKSPLFGFDDDDLIALAPTRTGSLMDALKASPEPRHHAAYAAFERWSARANAVTPFAFYVELLGRDGGRRLMEARLGPEAHDAIDEFLRLALTHEQGGAPSLGAFLSDIAALDSSIKRDMEGPGDAVRVMTVHAAKGLESKIVFLPDTCSVPSASLEPTIFDLNAGTDLNAGIDLPPVLVWSPQKTDDPTPVAAVRQRARQATMREYRRLLYVALTRAEERLYIAGFFKAAKPAPDCWNSMIEQAFTEADAVDVPSCWDHGTSVRRIVTPGATDDARSPPVERDQAALRFAPDWLFRPVATPTVAAEALRPSHAATQALRPAGAPGPDRAGRRKRGIAFGTALHLLLQHLPGLPEDTREAAGRAFLAQRRDQFPPAMHATVLGQALATMALPILAPLFADGARAEVAVIGTLARFDGTTLEVRGAIDRLVVTPDAVLVADFKTGVPEADGDTDEAAVPDAYVNQLALYGRVLAPLWLDRPLRMLLVWTAVPRVVELSPATLAAAVARLLSPASDVDALSSPRSG